MKMVLQEQRKESGVHLKIIRRKWSGYYMSVNPNWTITCQWKKEDFTSVKTVPMPSPKQIMVGSLTLFKLVIGLKSEDVKRGWRINHFNDSQTLNYKKMS